MFQFLINPTPTAIALVLLATLSLGACEEPRSLQPLAVSDGWVRLNPPGSMMTAGYGTFKNVGNKTLVLTGFSSAQFGDVTLHYTEDRNGTATMREAGVQKLAPGESLKLRPGGYHLMLMQRQTPTPEGFEVDITVELESGTTSAHTFTVRRR